MLRHTHERFADMKVSPPPLRQTTHPWLDHVFVSGIFAVKTDPSYGYKAVNTSLEPTLLTHRSTLDYVPAPHRRTQAGTHIH